MASQQYCLKWKYHHNNLLQMFSQLLLNENFTDVVLASEGKTLKAHKVVLCACSTYFEQLFLEYHERNPIVILKDMKYDDIQALVEFMYKGEINVTHDQLPSLLKTAEHLHVKGLAEVSGKSEEVYPQPIIQDSFSMADIAPESPEENPPKKRRLRIVPVDMPHSVFDQDNCMSIGMTSILPLGNAEDSSDMFSFNESSNMGDGFNSFQDEDSGAASSSTGINNSPCEPIAGFENFVRMNEYLQTGTRQQFWEEPATRQLMEMVKTKELEMKKAAVVMGVSYGTLYGRYREVYGCLKHPHRDMWSRQQYQEILEKLRKKEIDLTQASDVLNIKMSALSSYMSTLPVSSKPRSEACKSPTKDDNNEDSAMALDDNEIPIEDIKPNVLKITITKDPSTSVKDDVENNL